MHYISRVVLKLRSKISTLIIAPSDSISILGIVTSFNLTCNTKTIYRQAVVLAIPNFDFDPIYDLIINFMARSYRFQRLAHSFVKRTQHTYHLRWFLKVLNHLQNHYDNV